MNYNIIVLQVYTVQVSSKINKSKLTTATLVFDT